MSGQDGRIRFRTLGVIDLSGGARDGARLLGQSKRLALLCRLAVEPDWIRRDLLLGLLWPELEEGNARAALRQTLHYLRKSLGDDAIATRASEDLRLDPARVDCDARAFEAACDEERWEAAAALYGGEFMPGFHPPVDTADYDFWLDETRRRLWSRALDAARRSVDVALERDDPEAAIRWAREAHGLDPCDEPTFRRYAEVLHAAGEGTEALRAYDLFRRRLDEQLGVGPDEATRRVVERVRRREHVEPAATPADAGPGALPRFAVPLVGRVGEMERLRGLLADGDVRLVTLTGPGGVGKTRLAVEIARALTPRFDGVRFLPLASLGDPDDAVETVEETVDRSGLRGDGAPFLLLLDNVEHLVAAAPAIAGVLARSERLRVLATSREPLRIQEEHEFPVPPLSLPARDRRPAAGDLPLDSEAIALFVAHALRMNPSFELTGENVDAVVEVCRRLDGLPLAIELAAARMRSLTPAVLAARLGSGLDVLGPGLRDRADRQRTLERAIRWSVDLLPAEERALLADLAVFAGGMRLEAVEAVHEAASGGVVRLLDSLVEKNLLQRARDVAGQPRFEMLETIRAFLRDAAGTDPAGARRRHATFYAAWLEDGHRHFCTDAEAAWHAQIEAEHENVRAALRWCDEAGEGGTAARILWGVGYFWFVSGLYREGLKWTRHFLEDGRVPDEARGRLLVNAAALAAGSNRADLAVGWLEEGVRLGRASGEPADLLRALLNLGFAYQEEGRVEGAIDVLYEALDLARETDDTGRAAAVLCGLGDLWRRKGELDRARSCLEESRMLAEMVGDRGRVARVLEHLGAVHAAEGELDAAEAAFRGALEGFGRLGQRNDTATVRLWLGEIARRRGRPAEFRGATTDALHLYREIEYRPGMGHALAQLARVAIAGGDAVEAVRILSGVEAEVGRDALDAEPFHASALEEARRALDDAEFDRAWSLGKRFTLEYAAKRADALSPAVELRVVP